MITLRVPSKRKPSEKYVSFLNELNKRPRKENSFVKPPAPAPVSSARGNTTQKELKDLKEKYEKLEIEHEALKLSHRHLEQTLKDNQTDTEKYKLATEKKMQYLESVVEKSLEALDESEQEILRLKKSKDRDNNQKRDMCVQVCDDDPDDSAQNASVDFVPKNILKINSPQKFKEIELALLIEKNIDTLSGYYLGKICQNIEKEYMQQLALETFKESYLKDVSFKKGSEVYMKGSNMLKCWTRTIKAKFYTSASTEEEDSALDVKIATKIQEAVRVLKNTMSQR